jgi:hypothetical protein
MRTKAGEGRRVPVLAVPQECDDLARLFFLDRRGQSGTPEHFFPLRERDRLPVAERGC